MRIVSIQIGLPQTYEAIDPNDGLEREWTTAFYKEPVAGPVYATKLGLRGDGQADLRNHGGADKAINAYCLQHYPHWARFLGRESLPFGAFGENLTLEDAVESDVCVGDIYQAGNAVLQISQPRQPCWKMSRRWERPDLAMRVEKSGMTGWYFRVLTEGELSAGMSITLAERPNPQWTVAEANAVMHHRRNDREAARDLAAVEALSESWKQALRRRGLAS